MALLSESGRSAVTTRAVCRVAGVQPPTIYRAFGSMDGLLDAVAREGFLVHQRSYLGVEQSADPVADLRRGWDQHVDFGLAHPYLYSVMYGRADAGAPSFAAVTANEGLAYAIGRVAAAGLLLVDEPFAASSMTAAGIGATFTLLATPEADRSLDVSVRMREGFIGAIVADQPQAPSVGLAATAAALSALLSGSDVLHPAESALMRHWLDRLTHPGSHRPGSAV